jgi:hypothetical protein
VTSVASWPFTIRCFGPAAAPTPLALKDTTATGPARGLPGHTLVLIAHRHGAAAGGLVLSGHFGFGQTDVILSAGALDRFDGLATVTAREQQRYDLARFAWTLVSHVTSVVLLGLGAGDPLDDVATNLARRTLCPVFYNPEPVRFIATNGALTQVAVGDPVVTGPAFADATQAPTLTAGASEFLPGSQRRADPPKVLP